MTEFKSSLPADMVEPSSLGRIRNCTAMPLPPSFAPLAGLGLPLPGCAPVPQAWDLMEQQEANEAAGVVDLLLNDQLDEL
eukprot:2498927-Prymnesium_polylepis.1